MLYLFGCTYIYVCMKYICIFICTELYLLICILLSYMQDPAQQSTRCSVRGMQLVLFPLSRLSYECKYIFFQCQGSRYLWVGLSHVASCFCILQTSFIDLGILLPGSLKGRINPYQQVFFKAHEYEMSC